MVIVYKSKDSTKFNEICKVKQGEAFLLNDKEYIKGKLAGNSPNIFSYICYDTEALQPEEIFLSED